MKTNKEHRRFNISTEHGHDIAVKYQTRLLNKYDEVYLEYEGIDRIIIHGTNETE